MQEKKCSKCGDVKPVTDFYKHQTAKYGVNNKCKICCKACQKTYREENKERTATYREENREHFKEYRKAYHVANKERKKEYMKEWYEDNPEAMRKYGMNRRARLAEAFVESVDHLVVFLRDKGLCGICCSEIPVRPEDFHLDHIIPISRGGLHSYVNTQTSHSWCNQAKGNSLPEELDGRLLAC